jgi:glycosyltransferase involved in cell wall biosynthesis
MTFLKEYRPERVSVIIPTYNYSQFITEAVESALQQNIDDLELIIVDDGSTDDTRDKCRPYADRINYIFQKNAGLSAARNTGISNSTGEFIQFLDSDDILGPDSVALQVEYLKDHPEANVVVCRNTLFTKTENGLPKPTGTWRLFQNDLDVHLCHFNIAPPHAFLFRRDAIIQTGWFDPGLKACEDHDFWIRAATKGFIPCYNPSAFVYYRKHHRNMSANFVNQHLHGVILHRRISTLFDKHPEFPVNRRLEGLLAMTAGAILIVDRINDHGLDGSRDLIDLAINRIHEAEEIAASGKYHWNMLIKMYSCKILNTLSLPSFRTSLFAKDITKGLWKIHHYIKAPTSKTGFVTELFKTIIGGPPHLSTERRVLASLLARYFVNRLLPFKLKRFS